MTHRRILARTNSVFHLSSLALPHTCRLQCAVPSAVSYSYQTCIRLLIGNTLNLRSHHDVQCVFSIVMVESVERRHCKLPLRSGRRRGGKAKALNDSAERDPSISKQSRRSFFNDFHQTKRKRLSTKGFISIYIQNVLITLSFGPLHQVNSHLTHLSNACVASALRLTSHQIC